VGIASACLLCFSPTGATRRIGNAIVEGLRLDGTETLDITSASLRRLAPRAIAADILILGFPVYEEHVPEPVLDYLRGTAIEAGAAIAFCSYGNIGYGVSLVEIHRALDEKGIGVLSMGAFIGRHSFATDEAPLASGRPDSGDLAQAVEFGRDAADRYAIGKYISIEDVPGKLPLMARALPRNSARLFTKAPAADDRCAGCGACRIKCPADAIDESYGIDEKKCLRCFACVSACGLGARKVEYKLGFLVRSMLNSSNRKAKANLII